MCAATLRRTFTNRELTPAAWASERSPADYYITNPAIQRYDEGWVMAYKVVTAHYHAERFAICRLDENLDIVPGTVVPLSDTIPNITPQVGDPRLLVFGGQLWVLYCHFRLPSLLYLAPLDADTLAATGPGRPLLLDDRQWQEKNWMLFAHEGELWAVYTIAPHVILHLDLRAPDVIRCRRAYMTTWDVSSYARRFGALRGGTSPVRVGDAYYAFFHSVYFVNRFHATFAPAWHALRARLGRPEHWQGPQQTDGDVRSLQPTTGWIYAPRALPWRLDSMLRRYERRFARRHYVAGCYGFRAEPPFAPFCLSAEPVLWPEHEPAPQRQPRLSPLNEQVVFPAGAAFLPNGRWLVSLGIHDERCVLQELACSVSTSATTSAPANTSKRSS
ncbi:MAG: hypothetical protein IPK16_29525 [Anaerolineales bacterium]|nr:hypothetical protein [Anaerolineales bacterium]